MIHDVSSIQVAVFAVIYRWRLRVGLEQQFVDGWERVTLAIRSECRSYGSRLHRGDDGTWLAYARWPSAGARAGCEFQEEEGLRLMQEAIEERFSEIT